jgi:acyl transferase domain-containing protein
MSDLDPNAHIAIVGLACDFPQAATPRQFWANLVTGRCAVVDLDEAALRGAGVTDVELAQSNYVRAGIRLDGFDEFDAAFFGLSPREAAVMDPQHRRFLQCAWNALEDAGYRPDAHDRQTGVFAGSGMHWYLLRNLFGQRELLADMGEFLVRHLSNDKDFLSTRVSYQLDLRGPSLNVQTACSTSLVAVHLACQSLLAGECDMALAGGSTVEVPQGQGYVYREEEVRSADGRCRAFDADSGGTVFGSGCGLVVLRRLGDALRDGNHIVAVIRATAINNDGAGKAGYLAPSVDGQAEAIATALTLAGVEADSIGYVEAHGTGTRLGDPIEVAALSQAFEGAARQGCALGSLKTNIGHLDTAAGVAGLIKTALCLEHGELPPSLFYRRPNPEIDFARSPFFVVAERRGWPKPEGPRRAALNSLGVGGTNAFAVLEQAPEPAAQADARDAAVPLTLLLSAKTPEALRQRAAELGQHLRERSPNLADVAWTLREGRVAMSQRCALAARSCEQAAEQLAALAADARAAVAPSKNAPALVFAFPGQGAQRVGMARAVARVDSAVAAALHECISALRGLGREDVVELLLQVDDSPEATARLRQTELTQPVLFCVEYALARGLFARGLKPVAVVGHSLGEYVGATLAGVFELPSAIELICTRGRLCAQAGAGAMLAVNAGLQALRPLLDDSVDIAGLNSPQQTVLAGSVEAIDAVALRLEAAGLGLRRLQTSGAFHSRLLDPQLDAFRAAVERARPRAAGAGPRIVSSLSGEWLSAEQAASVEYWVQHLRRPVDFIGALSRIGELGDYLLIEVGPGRTLARFCEASNAQARCVATLEAPAGGDETCAWFALPGALWAHGLDCDFARWQQPMRGARVALPTYPFARTRHWIAPATPRLEAPARPEPAFGDWLQAQDWRSAPLVAAQSTLSGEALVLLDRHGLGAAVVDALRARGLSVRTLERDAALQLDEASMRLDPNEDVHWQALAALSAPALLIDLWSLDAVGAEPAEQQRLCFEYPLRMAQALSPWCEREGGLLCLAASVQAQPASEPSAVQPLQALRAGPQRTWPQEAYGLRAAWVDLDTQHLRQPGASAALLLAELRAGLPDDTVALRGRRRLLPAWTALQLPRADPRAAFKPGGHYLITGGFGGAGQALAEHLARVPQVQLILIARSALSSDPAHPRQRWLAALRGLGARVEVIVADVAEADLFAQATAGITALDGIFHAAGVLDDGLIARKTIESAQRVLAPKLAGAEAAAILGERCGAGFVLYFSSLSAQMGVSGQVDYTAANAALDAFAAQADARSVHTRHLAMAFSIWREAGMAARLAADQGLAPAPLADAVPTGHPMLARRRDEAGGRVRFAGVLDEHSHWVLDQHRLASGEALLPGTGYLDLLAWALAEYTGAFQGFELRELRFSAPFKLGRDEQRRLELELTPRGELAFEVSIESQGAAADDRIEHLRVSIDCSQREVDPPLLLTRPRETREPAYAHAQLRFGPRWNCLRRFEVGEGEAELQLTREDPAPVEQHPLHPALFDMAIGAAQAALAPTGVDAARLLPFRYGCLQVYAPLPESVISRQRARAVGADLVLDIDLLDAGGQRVLALRDFVLKPARALAAGTAPVARARPPVATNRILEVGFREGFSHADALAAIEAALLHAGPAQIALARRPVAELIVATRAPDVAESSDAPQAIVATPVQRIAGGTPFVAPAGELQEQLVALWEGLLDLSGIGAADDFFALGGHSLLLTRALSRLKRERGLVLPVEAAFETPTIAAWSALAPAAAAPAGPQLKRVDRSRFRADAAGG